MTRKPSPTAESTGLASPPVPDTPEDATAAGPRRRSRSRVALIEAAKRLLARTAITGFSIDDVVREADVARGTFYNQFSSVDELVSTAVQATQRELLEFVTTAHHGSPDVATQVARGVVASMLYCYKSPDDARVLIFNPPGAADPRSARNQLLVATLQRGLDSGELEFFSLDAAFATVLGICQVGTARMLEVLHEYSLVRELTHGLCVMALQALTVAPHRAEALAAEAVLDCFDRPLGRKV